MTDNLPAVVHPEPSREVATASVDSWIPVLANVGHLAERIAGTEFVPKSLRDSPAAVAAAILYGREVGLPPMTALTQTHVIEGKPSMSAEAMRALVLAAGHDIEVLESTGAVCKMRGRRRGSERWSAEVAWSIDMARAAGLTNKTNWKSYPRQMLQARTTGELVRLVFPDVIHGFRTVEEMEDLGGEEAPAGTVSAPQGTKAVGRRTAKKAPAPALEARPPQSAGPPLPGEAGYEEPAPRAHEQAAGGDTGEGEAPEPPPAVEDSPGSDTGVEGAAGARVAPDDIPADAPTEHRGPRKATRAQHRMIFAQLAGLGFEEDQRHWLVGAILGHPVESFNDLTSANASTINDTLARCKTKADLEAIIEELGSES